jgi:hypothetical protein
MRIYFALSFRPNSATIIKQKSNMYTAIAAMSTINNKEIKNQGGLAWNGTNSERLCFSRR